MADKTNMGAVLQFARDVDVKHDKGHGRLRLDLDRAEQRIYVLEDSRKTLEVKLAEIAIAMKATETAPIDVGKIMGNWRVIIGVAGLVVSIVTGNWFVTQPVRESLVRIQEQFNDNVRLQDERAKTVGEKIDTLNRQMEMRRLEIQQVSNDLQQLRRNK